MSNDQGKKVISPNTLYSRLSICTLLSSETLAQSLAKLLSDDRYNLYQANSVQDLLDFIEQHKEQLDCLIVQDEQSANYLFNQLCEQGTLLPTIIIDGEDLITSHNQEAILNPTALEVAETEAIIYLYHSAEVRLASNQIEEISVAIDQALAQFLHLAPSCALAEKPVQLKPNQEKDNQTFLLLQQRRLAEKLKERLGYLGVYYKRNPKYFCRNLPPQERQELIEELSAEYRQIILNYFSTDTETNQAIDQFVNRAFFADISVSQILEIHMELMDEFAQQLKLEGRSEEILLDYRLTLIDIIAHLGEMYRRSIPREDLPFELLFRID